VPNLLQAIRTGQTGALQRSYGYPGYPYDVANFNGNLYPLTVPQQTLGFKEEQIQDSYTGYAQYAYRYNPIVFACMEARRRLFSQARFQFQQIRAGTPGDLFGNKDLELLEHPWMHGVTSDLLNRIIQDADLAGNAFITRLSSTRLTVLRPDWCSIIAGSQQAPDEGLAAIDAEVIGLAYFPGGKGSGTKPDILLREEFAHFMPTPDPMAKFKGMSWLTPLVREVMADSAATTHKLKFFENGATPNLVVKMDPALTIDKFKAWVQIMEQDHTGVLNAYKTLYLGGGADATPVGANLRQIDFKVTQGAGETRIAADAGVPPIIVGLSEGLAAATYSNYGQARRAFSDSTMWDLWGNIAGSLEVIVPPPSNSRLWVDTRHIPFLQEDQKDAVIVQQGQAATIKSLIDSGFEAESVITAVTSGDMSRLSHTGLFSVQLQAPGSTKMPVGEAPGELPVGGGTAPVVDKPGAVKPAPPPVAGAPAAKTKGRALIDAATERLIEAGTKPTDASIAEELGISDRTVRRWREAA
jgi:phage portal protein BeeE